MLFLNEFYCVPNLFTRPFLGAGKYNLTLFNSP